MLRSASLAALALTLIACGNEKAKPATSAPEAEAKPAQADTAPVAAGDKVKDVDGPPPGEDERYAMEIEPPTEAKAGEESRVVIKIVPKKPWHMNLDFPTSLKMVGPDGVVLAKAEQKKADALKLDDNNCEYEVAFTPDGAGDKAFTGKFKFAVCQDEACSPVTEEVEFKVAVK
jgi:hypothetical protein